MLHKSFTAQTASQADLMNSLIDFKIYFAHWFLFEVLLILFFYYDATYQTKQAYVNFWMHILWHVCTAHMPLIF